MANKCEKCGIEISETESEISYNKCSYRLCRKHTLKAMELLLEFVSVGEGVA